MDPSARFWPKVEKTDTCWNWTAFCNAYGYGQFGLGGRGEGLILAHRYAWMEAHGTVPDSPLDHICHNRRCVNPDHLRVVTSKQNSENVRGDDRANNKSGYRGVSWDKERSKWRATLTHNLKHIMVGRYDTVEEANAAIVAKRIELFTHNDMDRIAA